MFVLENVRTLSGLILVSYIIAGLAAAVIIDLFDKEKGDG